MNTRLPSGSILPSGLLSLDNDMQTSMRAFNLIYANYGLKSGLVIKVYETDDEKNITGLVPEYDVAVFDQDGDGAQNTIVYKNCIATNLFGAVGDFLEYRYRVQSKVDQAGAERIAALQDGALVLINCLNGMGEKALIVGALTHPKRTSSLTTENGYSLLGAFNGVGFGIDKDGAFTISFQGATANDGTPLDSSVGGTYMKILKDGSIELSDGKTETIRIDKTKQTIDVSSAKVMSLNTQDKLNLISASDTNQQMANWMLQASGSATLSMQSLSVSSQAAVGIKGSSMNLSSDGMLTIKGQVIVLDGIVQAGGIGGTPAPTLLTQYIGTGNNGAPVSSVAIGPFSSKVFIAP
jgi:hypothetical protein